MGKFKTILKYIFKMDYKNMFKIVYKVSKKSKKNIIYIAPKEWKVLKYVLNFLNKVTK